MSRTSDNLGFVMGISSARFNEDCGQGGVGMILLPPLNELLEPEFRVDKTKKTEAARRQLFAPVPNPFKSYAQCISQEESTSMTNSISFDGGQS